MIDIIDKLRERISNNTVECESLRESDIWCRHGTFVWKTARFVGQPNFYPVYRDGNYYSYSLLLLIIRKGYVNLNQRVVETAGRKNFMYLAGEETIDSDIVRLGCAHGSGSHIRDVNEYASRIADALRQDIAAQEKRNPGYTNLVLCGGKDSLNLLLLPWKETTIAVSAEPNYDLVRQFVKENNLDCEVVRLEDSQDQNELNHEILECCCRADLQHWRWGAHLRTIAREHNYKAVFWKGQVGDLYMSNKWKTFMHPVRQPEEFARKVFKRLERPLPFQVNRAIGRLLQPRVIEATWDRCSALQGCHMGFIREITDNLVLSAYHGPKMIKVWSEADLGSVAQQDMRHLVGRILLGKDVIYPKTNPAPENSPFREGLASPDKFLRALSEGGIRVDTRT